MTVNFSATLVVHFMKNSNVSQISVVRKEKRWGRATYETESVKEMDM